MMERVAVTGLPEPTAPATHCATPASPWASHRKKATEHGARLGIDVDVVPRTKH
ncbi:hypothetical protein [Streptomyces sp. NBC_00455]|uniref:hypothetical protein n=1 Tax=Streptomyces sp. NBC_00455 TaxID=2903654 RepID=UPI002E2014C2